MAYPMSAKVSKTSDRPLMGSSTGGKQSAGDGSWVKGLVTLVVVLVIIGGGIYLIANYTGIGFPSSTAVSFKADWQAVFLTNGQVYFGKVDKIDGSFVYLADIYYLQVITLQNTIGQPPDVQTQPEQRLTLIKLGNEIHGPQDAMVINREHVVIMEDLKDDSRVVQAINDYINPPAGQ